MFITVIPSSHSIWITPLTYHVGDVFRSQIHIGSLVEIPLGTKVETGIVAGFTENIPENYEVKSIVQVICSVSILAPYQITLIESLAKRYMLPIHRVLGFFLTRPVISRLERTNFGTLEKVLWKEKEPSKEPSNIFFFHNSIINAKILNKYVGKKTIVICPDDFSLTQYRKVFENEATLFLPNDATDARRSKAWIDIRNGKYDVVFGTRKVLYFNLVEYSHILYLEDAFSDEYFHYPTRIQYLDVLKNLDNSRIFTIDILTSVPLLKTLITFRHFHLGNVT